MLYFFEQCMNGVQLGMLLFLLAAGSRWSSAS
jgi:branched-subunit amino acid ABC-type transport system permease component